MSVRLVERSCVAADWVSGPKWCQGRKAATVCAWKACVESRNWRCSYPVRLFVCLVCERYHFVCVYGRTELEQHVFDAIPTYLLLPQQVQILMKERVHIFPFYHDCSTVLGLRRVSYISSHALPSINASHTCRIHHLLFVFSHSFPLNRLASQFTERLHTPPDTGGTSCQLTVHVLAEHASSLSSEILVASTS